MTQLDVKPRSRDGGRSARRALRTAPNFEMLPGLTRNLPLCELMDAAQVERIDAAGQRVLPLFFCLPRGTWQVEFFQHQLGQRRNQRAKGLVLGVR